MIPNEITSLRLNETCIINKNFIRIADVYIKIRDISIIGKIEKNNHPRCFKVICSLTYFNILPPLSSDSTIHLEEFRQRLIDIVFELDKNTI